MYLSLQLLLAKDKSKAGKSTDIIKKFELRAFLKNKVLAKLFIRSFVKSYYYSKDGVDVISGRENLENLIRVLKNNKPK